VETLFVDRVVNLLEEGLNVAIRIRELPDLSLKVAVSDSPVTGFHRFRCGTPAGAPGYQLTDRHPR
jgi:hypothetical protein